jgi:GMP synthase (glutamine-hydrolysing)
LDFKVIAKTSTAPFAAIRHTSKSIFGIQFHPEVTHTPCGTQILSNFVSICDATRNWTMGAFIDQEIARIKSIVGNSHVIGAVSGGVDSTVAAVLMKRAIGDRFHAILVDNGVMRLNECAQVKQILKDKLGINLRVADASSQFLTKLQGITDPEQKRKIIGNTFIHVFEEEAAKLEKEIPGSYDFLLQGTLYPDVIESISFKGPSSTIKTHHNVGGLLDNMKMKLVEPLRELFKDEVRALGTLLGIDEDLVWRHPFPGKLVSLNVKVLELQSESLEKSHYHKLRSRDMQIISSLKKSRRQVCIERYRKLMLHYCQ